MDRSSASLATGMALAIDRQRAQMARVLRSLDALRSSAPVSEDATALRELVERLRQQDDALHDVVVRLEMAAWSFQPGRLTVQSGIPTSREMK
jgi:hypothetical protein